MPKERRDRSVSRDRCRVSPYPCSSSSNKKWLASTEFDIEKNAKEWEDARCPVCMEHPHNAVLLVCSSHEKGCRPYMCDTSYRHSNCLDQFRKSFSASTLEETPSPPPEPEPETTQEPDAETESEMTQEPTVSMETTMPTEVATETAKIMCPLCRGEIKEWTVDEGARRFMNAKQRSCSCETCSFGGTYADLRKHARLEHPSVRPSEADPARERSWRRLERQRDLGDLLSTLQSSMAAGGDNSNTDSLSTAVVDDEATGLPIDDGRWLTVFFLIRVFRSPGSSSRSRARAQLSIRRTSRLWGESYEDEAGSSSREEEEEEEDEEEDDNESSDGGSGGGGDGGGPEPRRRSERIRRRNTPDENQP